ncbi:MAG: GAF domain-containing protein [Desulfobacterales bacterium]|nr:GAF domain-containing protein [Desulfobacterales bacterium]
MDIKPSYEELEERLDKFSQYRKETDALLSASQAILEQRDFQTTARAIFDACRDMTGATSGYVALLDDSGTENEVLFLESGGRPCTVDTSLPMPIRGLRGEAYRENRVVYDNDFQNSKWAELMPGGHVELRNVMFSPLVIKGKSVGLIGLANKKEDFNENDARIASAFGNMAAVALLNSNTLDSLEKSEAGFRTVSELTSDYICRIRISEPGGQMVIDTIAGGFSLFSGYTAGELKSPGIWNELIYPDDLEDLLFFLNRVMSGHNGEFECRIITKNRQNKWLKIFGMPETDPESDRNNPSRSILTAMKDISEQTESRHRIQKAAEREALQRGKIEMAGSVLHDIGNAMTGISTAVTRLLGDVKWSESVELSKLERMIRQKNEDFRAVLGQGKTSALATFVRELKNSLEDRRHHLYMDYQSIAKTVTHVNEILHLQRRYVREGQTGQRIITDLGELIRDAVSIHLAGFEKRHISILQKFPDNLPGVLCDRSRMIQVFLNLFKNVCDAFDETEKPDDRILKIDAEQINNALTELTIFDNATGFDPDLAEHFFESGYTTRKRNSGMGLTQCRSIIEAHKGKIRIESAGPGQGTLVRIELPVAGNDKQDSQDSENNL